MTGLTKTQVDRLGERLRRNRISDEDLRLLDAYRRTFGPAYDTVIRAIQEKLSLAPSGRPAKSTTSIVQKLQRESIRLSQMQDIAGCRLVVPGLAGQDSVVKELAALFERVDIDDRRVRPSHGYRAVYLIVDALDRPVEIQVRTQRQHVWAELSERMAHVFDPQLKYGGGPSEHSLHLLATSATLAEIDALEESAERIAIPAPPAGVSEANEARYQEVLRQKQDLLRQIAEKSVAFQAVIRDLLEALSRAKGD